MFEPLLRQHSAVELSELFLYVIVDVVPPLPLTVSVPVLEFVQQFEPSWYHPFAPLLAIVSVQNPLFEFQHLPLIQLKFV